MWILPSHHFCQWRWSYNLQWSTGRYGCIEMEKAMNCKMESMYSNSVWSLIEAPEKVKLIVCNWIYKRKKGSNGNVATFKARLVGKSCTQKERIDYEIDVKTDFLNENLEEEIYM